MVNHESFICHYYKHVTFLVAAFWLGLLVHYTFGMAMAICLVHSLLMAELNLWSDGYHGSDLGTRFNQFFQECHRVLRRP